MPIVNLIILRPSGVVVVERLVGAIAPVPIFKGGAPLQFLSHLFLINFAYILQKFAFDLNYFW